MSGQGHMQSETGPGRRGSERFNVILASVLFILLAGGFVLLSVLGR